MQLHVVIPCGHQQADFQNTPKEVHVLQYGGTISFLQLRQHYTVWGEIIFKTKKIFSLQLSIKQKLQLLTRMQEERSYCHIAMCILL